MESTRQGIKKVSVFKTREMKQVIFTYEMSVKVFYRRNFIFSLQRDLIFIMLPVLVWDGSHFIIKPTVALPPPPQPHFAASPAMSEDT